MRFTVFLSIKRLSLSLILYALSLDTTLIFTSTSPPFFSILDKKTLTEEEKIARIKKEEKKQVKDDWTHTQDEIDRAF